MPGVAGLHVSDSERTSTERRATGHLHGVDAGLRLRIRSSESPARTMLSAPRRALKPKHAPRSLPAFCARSASRPRRPSNGRAASESRSPASVSAAGTATWYEERVARRWRSILRVSRRSRPALGHRTRYWRGAVTGDYPTTAALIEHGESDWRGAQAAPIALAAIRKSAFAGHHAVPHLLPGGQLSPAHDRIRPRSGRQDLQHVLHQIGRLGGTGGRNGPAACACVAARL